MKITEIYEKYKIMANLQEHMLRVAGVAALTADNFEVEVDKRIVVTAGLLHDMGNIVKFNFDSDVFPDSLYEPEGKDYWVKVKEEFIKKYGTDDHEVTSQILHELNVSKKILNLVNSIGFSNTESIRKSKDFELKIVAYSDQRVSPQSVVSMDERYEESRKRYANQINNKYTLEKFLFLVNENKEIEKQIFKHSKIKPEDINPTSVAPYIEKLVNFEIETD